MDSLPQTSAFPAMDTLSFAKPFAAPFEAMAAADGQSHSTRMAGIPLIAPPQARDPAGFQASIEPPKDGKDDTPALAESGSSMTSPTAKMAYIAALRLEMAGSSTNGASGDRRAILTASALRV